MTFNCKGSVISCFETVIFSILILVAVVSMPPFPCSKLYIRCEHQGQWKTARLDICMQRVNQCQLNLWVVAHFNIVMMIVTPYMALRFASVQDWFQNHRRNRTDHLYSNYLNCMLPSEKRYRFQVVKWC